MSDESDPPMQDAEVDTEKLQDPPGDPPRPLTPTVIVTTGGEDDIKSNASSVKSTKISLKKPPTRASNRVASPSRLPPELSMKARTQKSRIHALRDYRDRLDTDVTSSVAQSILQSAEETHRAFLKEHSYLEVTWPAQHLDHEYFEEDSFFKESDVMCDIRQLTAMHARPGQSDTFNQSQTAKLPKLPLPKFNGEYNSWPSFRDLFKSLVMENRSLSNLERLHYLRLSVTDRAAETICHVPLVGDAFPVAWEALESRYGNLRVLIDNQLANLFADTTKTDHQRESAAFLQQLSSNVSHQLMH